MNLAPIILFVYNRPWHTKKTLEALMQNNLADQSTLYIYCDGAKRDAKQQDIAKIQEIRKIVKSRKWCKEVCIIEREENIGLANSVIQGVTEVIEKHGSVIVLEDDIITGTSFLKYMNDGFKLHKDEQQVFGVTGYKYPTIKEISEPAYFLPISSSWSYATWLDRWNKVNFNGSSLIQEINKNKLKDKMNFGGYPFYQMLQNQIKGNIDSWAIRFYASMFLQESYFMYPNKSLVQNIGFDNSGTHCNEEASFKEVELYNHNLLVLKKQVNLNQKIIKNVKKSFELRFQKNKPNFFKKLIKKIKFPIIGIHIFK